MERPLDKTQQDYVDHGGIVNLLQSIKHGLKDLTITKTRDGKGGEVVSGLKRVTPCYLERAFGKIYMIEHERTKDDFKLMRTHGMLMSPYPKVMKLERVSGSSVEEHAAHVDSIKRKYDAWYEYCGKNHKPVRAAMILVWGEGLCFVEAAREMRSNGMKANHRTMEGVCKLGVELYEQIAKKF